MSGDIEIELDVVKESSHFTIFRNRLIRDLGLTLQEWGLLSRLLSFSSGWKMSRPQVDALASGLSEDTVSKILKGLESKGYLRRTKTRGERGRFIWHWRVSDRPLGKDDLPTPAPDATFPQVGPSPEIPGMVDASPAAPEKPPVDNSSQDTFAQVGPHPVLPGVVAPSLVAPSLVKPGTIEVTELKKEQDLLSLGRSTTHDARVRETAERADLASNTAQAQVLLRAIVERHNVPAEALPVGRQADELITAVARCLDAGWDHLRLRAALGTRSLQNVDFGPALLCRIRELPHPPTPGQVSPLVPEPSGPEPVRTMSEYPQWRADVNRYTADPGTQAAVYARGAQLAASMIAPRPGSRKARRRQQCPTHPMLPADCPACESHAGRRQSAGDPVEVSAATPRSVST